MSNPSLPAESAADRDTGPGPSSSSRTWAICPAGVGHHVINAFSAIVSNAELLRLKSPSRAGADPAALAETIIQTSLDAATVARRLIDFTRPLTTIESRDPAGQIVTLALDRLAEDVVAVEQSRGRPGITWVTELQPVPPIIGHATQLRAMIGHLIANAYEAMPGERGDDRHLHLDRCAGLGRPGGSRLGTRDGGRGA